MNNVNPRDYALLAARTAEECGGNSTIILEMNGLTDVTDYFVITTGRVSRHIDAICRDIENALAEAGCRPRSTGGVEGSGQTGWKLIDFVDFVVHVFSPELREYYEIEELWGDASQIEFKSDTPPEETDSETEGDSHD